MTPILGGNSRETIMKRVFDSKHIERGEYLGHMLKALKLCWLFLGTSLIGLAHVFVPSFLPEFFKASHKKIGDELTQPVCECNSKS